MQITVDRYLSSAEATLSRVSVDTAFYCYGLEDEYRAVKKRGETRIPAGNYKVALKPWGGFYDRQKINRNYRDLAGPGVDHPGMLWILDVKGPGNLVFEDILIHPGNTDRDTAGCLLVGTTADELRLTIGGSVAAYIKLYRHVWQAAERGTLSIDFQDHDR